MNWKELDVATRAGFIAGVVALVLLIVPPIALASALIAMGFSVVGWKRSHDSGDANPVAKWVVIASAALIVLVVAGSAIYATNT